MVTVSLTARDSFRERSKTFEESVENERNLSRLQTLTELINSRIEAIQTKLSVNMPTIEKGHRVVTFGENSESLDRMRTQLEELTIKLEEGKRLLDLQPSADNEERSSLSGLQDRLEELKKNRDRTEKEGALRTGPDPENLGPRIEELQEQTDKLKADMSAFYDFLLRVLEAEELRYQFLSSLSSAVTYLLIAIGISVSVYAQRIGKPGVVPEIKLGG
jgi:chromosome segregation ATPase